MPIYLCKPGWSAPEPWRHGVQVYAYPFRIDEGARLSPTSSSSSRGMLDHHEDLTVHRENERGVSGTEESSREADGDIRDGSPPPPPALAPSLPPPPSPVIREGLPLRRIRHAEVVLVDEVNVHHGRYWLRLRWPGPQGGFAGYIALGTVLDGNRDNPAWSPPNSISISSSISSSQNHSKNQNENENENENQSKLSPCKKTGLYFPSSPAMELLQAYDDGLSSSALTSSLSSLSLSSSNKESVFCRICREGLHDVDYDLGKPPNESSSSNITSPPSLILNHTHAIANPNNINTDTFNSTPQNMDQVSHTDHVRLLQTSTTHPTAENPLLSPCECSGSIKFVHYLCIEQWRCRSRHPSAQSGLNCETCSKPYTLPPPPIRPPEDTRVPNGFLAEGDWLDAMPPHVLAALRRPHLCWQIGAAVVRRKWLRPIAPVIISPIVALYCRSRRMLKKRGVSRRRWACSLCRRRARWKCVRCLRSYYCSRQCQNVSWHIVHKHVCYKPSRFGWSVLVYGVGVLAIVPQVIENPLVYILSWILIPACFFLVGILGGGMASLVKKTLRIDIRGRLLELYVVLTTVLMSYMTSGILWGFFGSPDKCIGLTNLLQSHGYLPPVMPYVLAVGKILSLKVLTYTSFHPFYAVLQIEDKLFRFLGGPFAHLLCQPLDDIGNSTYTHCFRTVRNINPNLLLENTGLNCAADVSLLFPMIILAAVMLLTSALLKRQDPRQNDQHRHNANVQAMRRMPNRVHHHPHRNNGREPRFMFAAGGNERMDEGGVHLHHE